MPPLVWPGLALMALLTLATGADPVLAAGDWPPDVAQFVERRALCEHFRGEPWPEEHTADAAARRAFIQAQWEIHCRGTDRELAVLLERHGRDPVIGPYLEGYEPFIETAGDSDGVPRDVGAAKPQLRVPSRP